MHLHVAQCLPTPLRTARRLGFQPMNTGHDDVRHVEHGSMPHVDDGEEIERFERFPSGNRSWTSP